MNDSNPLNQNIIWPSLYYSESPSCSNLFLNIMQISNSKFVIQKFEF